MRRVSAISFLRAREDHYFYWSPLESRHCIWLLIIILLSLPRIKSRYYDERPVHQVVLPIKYGLDVDTVRINGNELEIDEYHLDRSNGIVYIHPHNRFYRGGIYNHFKTFKIDITYITTLPEYVKNKLKPLIIDIILYNQIPEAKKGIRRVTEGDTTIEYDKNTTITYLSAHRISTQLKGIRQLLYPSTTMMI